jgi:hypothetical protein
MTVATKVIELISSLRHAAAMYSWLQSRSRGYFLLGSLWVITHALPLLWLANERLFHMEIVQAKKLLDYGFWARKGALLAAGGWCNGMLANPGDHNYVNHPYPIWWLYTLLYWLSGKIGVYSFVALSGLASCLITYWFLKRVFPLKAALFSASLVAMAHSEVEFGTNTDVLAQSAVIWPFGVLFVVLLKKPNKISASVAAFMLGLVVFVAGQINWFALTTLPALLLLCLPANLRLGDALRRPWSVPGWIPILLGGALTLALFIGQVLVYSSSLRENANYLSTQVGSQSFIDSRLRMLPVLMLRMLLAAPALWLGALVCLTQLRQRSPERLLVGIMLIYLAVFIAVMLTIPRLLFLNQHGFRFNVFPCAVMTAYALACLDAKWLRIGILAVAISSLLFCYAKLHDRQASTAANVLGRWLGAHTKPEEVVLTNLKYLTPPIQSWDGEFIAETRMVSDRLVFLGSDSPELAVAVKPFLGHSQSFCFLWEHSQPIDADLGDKIKSAATGFISTDLVVTNEDVRIFKMAKAALWSHLKGCAPQYAPRSSGHSPETNAFTLTLYRLPPSAIEKLGNTTSVRPQGGPPQRQ